MQAIDVAPTDPHAPYDTLRPMRCRYEFQGQGCHGRGGDVDWSRPGTHSFRCPKCRSFNVVHVTEAQAGGR
jgi:hypothetical protein